MGEKFLGLWFDYMDALMAMMRPRAKGFERIMLTGHLMARFKNERKEIIKRIQVKYAGDAQRAAEADYAATMLNLRDSINQALGVKECGDAV